MLLRAVKLSTLLLVLSLSPGCDENSCGHVGAEGDPCTLGHKEDCIDDLICYNGGDTIVECTAVCRPRGTECVKDQDCDTSGQILICESGYCHPTA